MVIRKYFDEIWNADNTDLTGTLLAPHYAGFWLVQGVPMRIGRHQHPGLIASLRAAYPDMQVQIQNLCTEGEVTTAHVAFRGTNAGFLAGCSPTDLPLQSQQVFEFKVVDEQIIEERCAFENRANWAQIVSDIGRVFRR